MGKDHRFDSSVVEVCPLQPVVPTKRVGRLESLDLKFIEDNVRPNARAGINSAGRLLDLRGRTDDKSVETRQLTVVTMSPWGPDDLMVIDLGKDRAPALIDVPEPVLTTSLRHQSHILERFQEGGRTVYFGQNHGVDLVGEGLQSVKAWHSHLWRFSEKLEDLTPEVVKEIRNNQVWDEGASRIIGEQVGGRIQREVLPMYREGYVEADAMGFTIEIPGFNAKDVGRPEFVSKFLRPVSLIMHDKLRELHSAVFKSSLDDVIRYVLSRKGPEDVDWGLYNSFFERIKLAKDAPGYIAKLHEMDEMGELRQPVGWTMGIQISKERKKAMVVATVATPKRSIGPVESMGVDLVRTQEKISQAEMDRKVAFYDSCIEEQLRAA